MPQTPNGGLEKEAMRKSEKLTFQTVNSHLGSNCSHHAGMKMKCMMFPGGDVPQTCIGSAQWIQCDFHVLICETL